MWGIGDEGDEMPGTKRKARPSLKITAAPRALQPCALQAKALARSRPSGSPRAPFAHQIVPHLFLGTAADAQNEVKMRQCKITYVLNVARECVYSELDDVQYFKIEMDDRSDFPIEDYLFKAFEVIDEAIATDGNVMVHCHRGISRSAAVVIAYVMYRKNMSFDDAFQLVKSQRDVINPNLGFVLVLEQLEGRLPLPSSLSPAPSPSKSSHVTACVLPQQFQVSVH